MLVVVGLVVGVGVVEEDEDVGVEGKVDVDEDEDVDEGGGLWYTCVTTGGGVRAMVWAVLVGGRGGCGDCRVFVC